MGDPLDELIADKIEKTAREEELQKEIDSVNEKIDVLRKEDSRLMKDIPKPSDEKLVSLRKEKEVLLKLLKDNKASIKIEETNLRKKRSSMLRTEDRNVLKTKIRALEDVKNELWKEMFREQKKRKVWKDGKLIQTGEVNDAPAI